jgi:O-antigen ligase
MSPVLEQFCWSVLLVMCLIQYTSAWLYPAVIGFGGDAVNPEKILGAQFQWLLWLSIAGGVLLHVLRSGFDKLFKILKIFLPFAAAGLIASLFGFDPVMSLRYFILWTLALTAAALIGSELAPARAIKVLGYTMLCLMLGSVLMAIAVPSVGVQHYGSEVVWRGIFTNKNQLGWVSAMALVFVVSLARRLGMKLSGMVGLLACVCLLFSGSKGALAAAMATLGFAYLIAKLGPRVTLGFGVGIIAFLVVVGGIFGFLVLPYVLEALGRDMTLTGRTDVWAIFFHSMSNTLWFGQGPGAYTGISPLTAPLAIKLQSLGAIYTPHNTYLGVLGDSGLFGLVTFSAVLSYTTVIVPLSTKQPLAIMGAAIGFLILAHGVVETHDVFSPGIGWFLLALARALTLRDSAMPSQSANAQSADAAAATLSVQGGRYGGARR